MQATKADPHTWLDRYGDYLYRFALLRVNHHETAEDLVSSCFESALKNIHNFRGDSNEKTWLTRILQNKIIDHYRSKGRLKTDSFDDGESRSVESHFFDERSHWKPEHSPVHWADLPDSGVHQDAFNQILEACMGKLPPGMRSVFLMKFLDDLESDEICKELEITSSNYWVLLHRARLIMRECLDQNWRKS